MQRDTGRKGTNARDPEFGAQGVTDRVEWNLESDEDDFLPF